MTETITDTVLRRRLLVGGQVQGVGFRPFVYRLAVEHVLSGSVGNTSDGVSIEVQGTPAALDAFAHDLVLRLPPLARIVSCIAKPLPCVSGEDGFHIISSHGHSGHSVLISPDVGLCDDCRKDMGDPQNRRYRYPFTNCTNCGPRYTITRAIPYDRATTSMACFPLCPECQAEYDNPLDRRFHAQPNACPVCGPQVWCVGGEEALRGEEFLGGGGETFCKKFSPSPPEPSPSSSKTFISGSAQRVGESEGTALLQGSDALKHVADCLRKGRLAAIKGLGGFHLSCDAMNASVVALLRERKKRPHKPLAVMVPDVDTARQVAHVGAEEETLLDSMQRPIVLCRKRAGILPESIAPDVDSVGLVLPYTPLHVTLLELYRELLPHGGVAALVMTSGNAGGEPICLGNREALRRLSRIADVFLLHNRDILVRNDDSVVGFVPPVPAIFSTPCSPDAPETKVLGGRGGGLGEGKATLLQKGPFPSPKKSSSLPSPLFYRRARGYVPGPVNLGTAGPCVLGTGPELKATVCLTRGNAAFVSQHVGDLQNLETFGFYEEVAAHLEMLLESRPEAVVHDLHPDFMSTVFAQELAAQRGVPCWSLQHHFAHAWAVLAEHGYAHDHMGGEKGPALALVLDGTGLGDDGTIWGGELLWVDAESLEQKRLGRLRPFALPGGEAAIREPWRSALALENCEAGGESSLLECIPGVEARSAAMVREMLRRKVNCPLTSSAGRLFDAVSAALGLCARTTYEGQAAVRLEEAQRGLPWDVSRGPVPGDVSRWGMGRAAPCAVEIRDGLWELDSYGLFAATLEVSRCASVVEAARAFHVGLAQGLADMASRAANLTGARVVALSGGAMQNATLAALLPQMLARQGLTALLPRDIPANDGGVSLGQAVWGRQKLLRGL